MTVLVVAIVLAFVSVATFPCWSYSAGWSHLPSVLAGALLLCAAMVAVGARSAPKAADAERDIASVPPLASAYNALHRRLAVDIQPERAFQ